MIEDELDFFPMIPLEEGNANQNIAIPEILPILPLKNTVLFPGVVIPISVGREKSIKALKEANENGKLLGVIAQNNESEEDPTIKTLYKKGTVARVVKILKLPDGNTTAILQGVKRFVIKKDLSNATMLKAKIEPLIDIPMEDNASFDVAVNYVKEHANQIIQLSPNLPSDANVFIKNIEDPIFLLHLITSNLNIENAQKQAILEEDKIEQRIFSVLKLMSHEVQLLELKSKIQHKVRTDLDKQQRDYFLHQQIKGIQEELGQDTPEMDIERLEQRAETKKFSKAASEVFKREINKLRRTNPSMADYNVSITYIEMLLDLPWDEYTEDNFDIANAEKVLNRDHFGLELVKERILEYLAVLKLKGDLKSPILCLVGPPGVGKTSLGKSIASALGRQYIRMSLGGLHDESEIRGHRKTYIGAMPGRIIQNIKKAKSSNPVFILDEIDKLGKDFRGDPSSALLEVLDPEQNSSFYDNYLELEYDLSKVMFIATANSLSSIQPALLDRMEIIEMTGYSVEEKAEIAKSFLIPKQIENHGLSPKNVKINNRGLDYLITTYTRESGVRNLDRTIAQLMRKIAKKVAVDASFSVTITNQNILEFMGSPKFEGDIFETQNPPGIAVGLAWTSVGGDVLFIESNTSKGKGGLTLTGSLGDVMKESATTALSYIRSHTADWKIDPAYFEQNNFHIHVPEGGIPKDGPSAGITLLTSLYSSITGQKVKPHVAMTGEITLRGKVLPVGGIKEKILAAKRYGIKEIILSEKNKKDVSEIKETYLKGIKMHYVSSIDQVLALALTKR